jgi:hypothetical protein
MSKLAVVISLMAFACCGEQDKKADFATPCTCPIDRWANETGGFTYWAEEYTGNCEFLIDSFFDDVAIPIPGECQSSGTTPNCKDGVSTLRQNEAADAANRKQKKFGRKPMTPGQVKPPNQTTAPPLPNSTEMESWYVKFNTAGGQQILAKLFLLKVPHTATTPLRTVGVGSEVSMAGNPQFEIPKKYVATMEPPTPDPQGKHWEYDIRLGSTVFHVVTTKH